MSIKAWVMTHKGNQFEVQLPCKREMCTHCDGKGTHVNPAIDGNGLSQELLDGDPDFAEAYFSGRYDVWCEVCEGERVIEVIDYDRLTDKMKMRLERQWRHEAFNNSIAGSERRAGA